MKKPTLTLIIALFTTTVMAEITEDDLFMYGDLPKYKKEVVQMLNRLAKKHPACRKRLKTYTVGISKERSKPGNPSFFVQCGDTDVPEVVRFTLEDICAGMAPKAAKAISSADGVVICKKEARRRANNPSSLKFSNLNVNYDAKPNGNVLISSIFSVENDFGARKKYRIFCSFDGQQKLTGVTIKDYR